MMDRFWSWLPEIISWLAGLAALAVLCRQARRSRKALRAAVPILLWIAGGIAAGILRAAGAGPRWGWLEWVRGSAPLAAVAVLGWVFGRRALARAGRFEGGRRGFLKAAGGALAGLPLGAAGYGVLIERLDLRPVEVELPVEGLPEDLDGLRIAQITDIHLGPFFGEEDLRRAVEMANHWRPHLAVVTGDLVSSRDGPLEACLRHLARLKAEAGVLGCHGNHESYAGLEQRASQLGARSGIAFLRGERRQLRFGRACLNVAGVDYQPRHRPYLREAGRLAASGATNLLLSHNPDVFPIAARQGFHLTLAGHTHGGQINFEISREGWNVARFWTPFVYGAYRLGSASLFVSRGLGTVGMPLRLGAPPEVALIRLRRAPDRVAGMDPRRCVT